MSQRVRLSRPLERLVVRALDTAFDAGNYDDVGGGEETDRAAREYEQARAELLDYLLMLEVELRDTHRLHLKLEADARRVRRAK